MHDTLLLKLTTLMMTTPFSVQAQAAEEGRGRWWLWLVLLLASSVVVAWLLGRESGRQAERSSITRRPTHEPEPRPPTASTPPTRFGAPPAASLSEQAERTQSAVEEPALVAPSTPATTVAAPAPPANLGERDDLTKIEGIGPKIKSVLQEAGIATFADLANADTAHLKQILVDAGLRIHNPTTWPEQAALAGAGRWDDLRALKGQLSAGRRN